MNIQRNLVNNGFPFPSVLSASVDQVLGSYTDRISFSQGSFRILPSFTISFVGEGTPGPEGPSPVVVLDGAITIQNNVPFTFVVPPGGTITNIQSVLSFSMAFSGSIDTDKNCLHDDKGQIETCFEHGNAAFNNSYDLFIDPITPGATYTAESGHSYLSASAVPEPASGILIALGFVGILAKPKKLVRGAQLSPQQACVIGLVWQYRCCNSEHQQPEPYTAPG
jgi:hypothetical protein